MSTLPPVEMVRTLPAYVDLAVPEDHIDVNGHMNIVRYVELATYVHVSTRTRRSTAVPDHVGTALDRSIAVTAWVAPYATRLALRGAA